MEIIWGRGCRKRTGGGSGSAQLGHAQAELNRSRGYPGPEAARFRLLEDGRGSASEAAKSLRRRDYVEGTHNQSGGHPEGGLCKRRTGVSQARSALLPRRAREAWVGEKGQPNWQATVEPDSRKRCGAHLRAGFSRLRRGAPSGFTAADERGEEPPSLAGRVSRAPPPLLLSKICKRTCRNANIWFASGYFSVQKMS